ncbi:glycosyltransferase [Hymenobacter lucidus]|uniref:Glycosyltransferase n=1 Tax=Hymenobacter lucidus TaxID=2880930 RepID=A0ABS8API2_9BACT|nr:glycosyltransferase [Hymenobacter lucidus]MCB2407644.1 glycosyltransferase [Hymenobacter lucidus]
MESHPLKVLLLGWDDSAQGAEPTAAPALDVSRRLAAFTPVSVIVPRLPEASALTATDQILSLNTLSNEQLAAATARPAGLPGTWQAPAAPYTGSGTHEADNQTIVAEYPVAATSSPTATPSIASPTTAQEPQTLLNSDEFAVATAEMGTDEAEALSQPQNDLTLDSGVLENTSPAAPAPMSAKDAAGQASFIQALQALDGVEGGDLNFRVIQYARFATPMAVSQPFGVIYAAAWPAWLAALEIRQMTGCPLVLHVQSLAADRDSPADRGWILELERLTLRRAELILANTEALAQRLTSFYSLPAARIRVVAATDTAAINEALTSVASRS